MIEEIPLETKQRNEFVDITHHIQQLVLGVKEGIVTVHVPHTTAGITINENADPDVQRDMLMVLSKLVPANDGYKHAEGNSDSHVKASLMGNSVSVIVRNGQLLLGTWQGIYFCEFDGPRKRKVVVQY